MIGADKTAESCPTTPEVVTGVKLVDYAQDIAASLIFYSPNTALIN